MTRPRSTAARAHRRHGFTLLEVLTATGIMMVIIIVLLQAALSTFSAYDSAISSLKTLSSARTALLAMEQDLQCAVIPNDRNIWFQVEHENREVGNLTQGTSPKIMFFSSVPDRIKLEAGKTEPIPGDICAINYQIAQRAPFDNPGEFYQRTYSLYRGVLDAKTTFSKAIPLASGSSTGGVATDENVLYTFWTSAVDGVLGINNTRIKADLRDWVTRPQNYLTGDIVGMSLVFYYYVTQTDGSRVLTALAHEDIANEVRTALAKANLGDMPVETYNQSVKIRSGQVIIDSSKTEDEKSRVLQAIEVIVTCLGPDGVEQLRNLQQTERRATVNQERFNRIMTVHGEKFTIKVNMAK